MAFVGYDCCIGPTLRHSLPGEFQLLVEIRRQVRFCQKGQALSTGITSGERKTQPSFQPLLRKLPADPEFDPNLEEQCLVDQEMWRLRGLLDESATGRVPG